MDDSQEANSTTPAASPELTEQPEAQALPLTGGANLPAATTPLDPVADKKLRETVEAALGADLGSPEIRARIAERVVQRVSAEFYRGPLPHPRHLKAYEDTCPGLATRIVAMAEKAHSRQEDRLDKAMDYEYGDRRLGLFLGFFALLALLGAGVIVIAMGDIKVGATLLGAAVIGTVIGTFVHGRRPMEEAEKPERPEQEATDTNGEKPSLMKRMLSMLPG